VTAGNNQSNYYSSNRSRLLVFKLGGAAKLPDPGPAQPPPPFDPPEEKPAAELVALGEEAYDRTCAGCHGQGARNNGNFPDLRRSNGLKDGEYFKSVVLGGALADNGMRSFAEILDDKGSDSIRAYLISLSQAAKRDPALGRPVGGPPDEAPAPVPAPQTP
jgi:quinohemoprotein ethanol dehydrogenase